MTRCRWILAAALAFALAGACNKPDEADCRKAIRNMQRLLGTDKLHSAQNVDSAVRSCRGASKRTSVTCAIQAQTLAQLQACPFWKEQGMQDEPTPPVTPPATPPVPPAAPAGSAAPAAPVVPAPPAAPAPGSAAGSGS